MLPGTKIENHVTYGLGVVPTAVNLMGCAVLQESYPLGMSAGEFLDWVNWGGKTHPKC